MDKKLYSKNMYDDLDYLVPSSFVADPGYYSGRGATKSDLNSDQLEKIHKVIEIDHGFEAGEAFVQMVSELEVASATRFVFALYQLFNDKFVYHREKYKNLVDSYTSDIDIALITVYLAFTDRDDQTLEIVSPFLANHGTVHCTDKRSDLDRLQYPFFE